MKIGTKMKKINVSLFSVFCLILTLYSLSWPSYYQELLISSSPGLLALRTIICASMLGYVFKPEVRTYFAKTLMRAGGMTLLLFGLTTFVYPGLFGTSATYVPIADSFILLEGGVLALLLSLELPAQEPVAASRNLRFQYFANLLASHPKKLTRAARPSSR